MILTLPKLNAAGQFKMTAIAGTAITGVEPCTVRHQDKTYEGSKVYTDIGSFKCFCAPDVLATKWNDLLTTSQMQTVQPLLLPASTGVKPTWIQAKATAKFLKA